MQCCDVLGKATPYVFTPRCRLIQLRAIVDRSLERAMVVREGQAGEEDCLVSRRQRVFVSRRPDGTG